MQYTGNYVDVSPNQNLRESLKKEIFLLLGGTSVNIELSDDQYEMAITNSVRNYRAWGKNSYEEAFLHMKFYESQSVYTLPTEIHIVRKIYRRGNGVVSGSGATVDPFSLAYSNTYLLSAVRGSTGGGLLTYELYHQFDETTARLFGRDIVFTFDPLTHKLIIERDIRGEEEVLLHVYQRKPEIALLSLDQIYVWIRDWALSESMLMLGRSRSKWGSLPGPQGTATLDGDSLKQEAQQIQERLRDELRRYKDGGEPLGFIIG